MKRLGISGIVIALAVGAGCSQRDADRAREERDKAQRQMEVTRDKLREDLKRADQQTRDDLDKAREQVKNALSQSERDAEKARDRWRDRTRDDDNHR
jgi:hypothetical protein